MKGTSFKNAGLSNVVFFNCNLKGDGFSRVTLKEVTFICTNIKETKNFVIDNFKARILCTYSSIPLDELAKKGLFELGLKDSTLAAKVLHVNKNKSN